MANIKQFVYAISRVPQPDYRTPVAPTSSPKNYDKVLRTNRTPAELTPGVTDNSAYTTGTAQATEREVSNFDIAPVFENERMNVETLGRRAFAAFGDYSVEALGGGVFKHTFTTLDIFNVNALPTFTIIEKLGEPALAADDIHNKKIPSNTVESFTLSSGDDPYVVATTNWRGSGKRITPANVNFGAIAVRQEETATIVGAITTAGSIAVTVTAAGMTGSPKTINVPVFLGDTADQVAYKTRIALANDADITALFRVFGTGAKITLQKLIGGADDATLNIAYTNGTAAGLTADATSDTIVAGSAAASHIRNENDFDFSNFKSSSALLKVYPDPSFTGTVYANQCGFKNHTVTLNNGLIADEGYSGCPVFFEDGNPASGSVRSELPSGGQSVDLTYTIRVSSAVAQQFNPEGKLETQAYFSSELSYFGSQIAGTNYTETATFKYPRQTVAASRIEGNNDIAEYSISSPPLAFGNSAAISLEIISTIPDYSVAQAD